MTTLPEPGSEEAWRYALQLQRRQLQHLEENSGVSPRELWEAPRREERIWEQGRPEWQKPGRHNKMPLPQPVEKPE